MSAAAAPQDGPGRFAEIFQHLRATRRLRPPTQREIEGDIRKANGDPHRWRPEDKASIARGTGLKAQTIGYLLSGHTTSPGRATMQAIADYYRIPVGVLASDGPICIPETDGSVADRINGLIGAIRPGAGDVEYTTTQLAAFAECTEGEIHALREGRLTDISAAVVQRFAATFGVRVGYILDGTNAQVINTRIALMHQLHEGGAIQRTLRELQVSDSDQFSAQVELVRTLLQVETRPAVPAQTDSATAASSASGVEEVQFRPPVDAPAPASQSKRS